MMQANDPRNSFFARARDIYIALACAALACIAAFPAFVMGAAAVESNDARKARFEANQSRREAIRALGASKESKADSDLEAALEDEHPLARGEAAKALGKRKSRRALNKLESLLASSDDQIRRGAIQGLAERGEGGSLLVPMLSHADQWTRWEAAKALGRLKAGSASAALAARAKNDAAKPVRQACLESLGQIGAPGRAALTTLSKDANKELAGWAANVLKAGADEAKR